MSQLLGATPSGQPATDVASLLTDCSRLLQAVATDRSRPTFLFIDEFQLLSGRTPDMHVKGFFDVMVGLTKDGLLCPILATSESCVTELLFAAGLFSYAAVVTLWDADPERFVDAFALDWAAEKQSIGSKFEARLAFARAQLPSVVDVVGTRWLDVHEVMEHLSSAEQGRSVIADAEVRHAAARRPCRPRANSYSRSGRCGER